MALAVCLFNPRKVSNGRLPKYHLTALFTIGVAYGMGIVVALVVCTATSGGHFSPGVTLVHLIFNRFPPAKAIRSANSPLFAEKSSGGAYTPF